MRIKKIELNNHPILGNFIIDFSIDNSVRAISLLVAENGCGKTVLLEEIQKILTGGLNPWNDKINRRITFEFTDNEKKEFDFPTNIIIIDYNESRSTEPNWIRFSIFDDQENDISGTARQKIYGNHSLNKIFKCAFSTVEINFEKRNIESIKATTIDSDEFIKNRSTPNIATEIAQLLVDIKNQDNAEMAKHFLDNKLNRDLQYKGKFDRFRDAYSKMFIGKELLDIDIKDNNYKVIFNDKIKDIRFDISDLSSGEKQVVYRVGYLLRNLRGINNGIVLIDEPELSLHPIWQEKYLQFLREIFFLNNDIQFIIATHSPLLLKGALDKDIAVHILKRNDLGNIVVTNAQESGFGILKWSPSWGEICYFAYDLSTIEFHDDLYSAIEDGLKNNSTNKISQEEFEKYINEKKPNVVKIKWPDAINGPKEETIMTFVRNRIHHPDNTDRPIYTPAQMKESIDSMIEVIKKHD